MWRLKIAVGSENDKYLYSTNNYAGRQIWEFDSDYGSAEEKAEVERARNHFWENRYKVKPSGDVLWQMQFLREKRFKQTIPQVKIADGEEISYEKTTATVKRAAHYFAALQASDGHWPAENAGPLFFLPPLVPFNAIGTVRVEIHDTRLNLGDTLQAEYTFPITAHIKLNFFSSSYFSVSEPIPWKACFVVQATNINNGTTFCKMRAHLRLSSEKTSTQVTFKPPTVELMCTNVKLEEIDYKHVSKGETQLQLCGTQNNQEDNTRRISHTRNPALLPGQSLQDTLRFSSSRYSISDDSHTVEEEGTIKLTPTGLAKIINETTTSSISSKPL